MDVPLTSDSSQNLGGFLSLRCQFRVYFSWGLEAHLFNSFPTPLPNPTAKDDLAAKNAISRITAFSMQERNQSREHLVVYRSLFGQHYISNGTFFCYDHHCCLKPKEYLKTTLKKGVIFERMYKNSAVFQAFFFIAIAALMSKFCKSYFFNLTNMTNRHCKSQMTEYNIQ